MPKRPSDYVADDFVTADDESSTATHAKKRRKDAAAAAAKDGSNSVTNARKIKDGKAPVPTSTQRDDNGDEYWELSAAGTRRVTVNTFKGSVMVNVREYYEAGGKKLPGKKGISLPLDQFTALVEVLPQIEIALKKRGESVPRPDYSGGGNGGVDDDDNGDDQDGPEDSADSDGGKKKNFEATSDEDE